MIDDGVGAAGNDNLIEVIDIEGSLTGVVVIDE